MGSTWNGQNWSLEGRPKATSTISIAGVALPTDVTVPRAVLNLNKSPHPKQRIPYIDNIFCNYLFIIGIFLQNPFLFFTYVKILCTWHKQRSPEEPKNNDGDKTYKNAYFMERHRTQRLMSFFHDLFYQPFFFIIWNFFFKRLISICLFYISHC